MATKASWIEYLARFGTPGHEALIAAHNCQLPSFMEVRPARRCSSCGQQGHNARTCLEKDERIGSARPLDHTLQEAASQDRFEQQGSADGSSHLQGPASRLLGIQAASMSGSESEAQNVSQLPHISRERRRGAAIKLLQRLLTGQTLVQKRSLLSLSSCTLNDHLSLLYRYTLDGGGTQGISCWSG